MIPFDTLLDTLTQITIRARLHWDIWWAYEGETERPKHLPVMQEYSDFVRFDLHAHLTSCIVCLYQLYERNRKTHNLSVLLDRAACESGIGPKVVESAKRSLDRADELAKKVRILRNNAFGHRSLKLNYDAAFAQAHITPFELRCLCKTALGVVNHFHKALGHGDWPFNDLPVDDLRRLLRDLRDFHGLEVEA